MEAAMNTDFGSIFSRAWNITWKHKILWVFGFFTVLVGGSNGSYGNNFSYRFGNGDTPRYYGQLPPEIQSIVDWANKLDWGTIVAYISIALTVMCFLWVVFAVLSILGRGGLIGGIAKADSDGAVSFREAWALGRRYFWRLLAVMVLEFLTMLAAVFVILLPVIILAVIPFVCCLGIPLAVVVLAGFLFLSLYFYFVQVAIATEDLSLTAAFGKAFNVLRDRIVPSFVIGLILFIVNIGIALATAVLFVPSMGLLFAAFWPMIIETGALNMGLLYAAIIVGLVTLPVAWLIESVVATWRTAVWTLAYRQFARSVPPAQPPATL
jgi:hypothetical protein